MLTYTKDVKKKNVDQQNEYAITIITSTYLYTRIQNIGLYSDLFFAFVLSIHQNNLMAEKTYTSPESHSEIYLNS